MTELFRTIVQIGIPIFVISAMLNVGLTNTPSAILGHLKERSFMLKMVIANLIVVPVLTLAVLRLTSFGPGFDVGLLVFGLCAGAPFLIKLTETAEHDLALGAATMMLLMVLTVVYVPLVLPRLLPGATVGPWPIARPLLVQMLLPIAAGMLITRFLSGISVGVQPWIARLSNIALYAILGSTLIGYLSDLFDIIRSGAILALLFVVVASFGIGYLAGWGKDHHEDVGGLGTAQRNTAAGLIIATENFGDSQVLVVLLLATLISIVMLLVIARGLSKDNEPDPVPV